MFKKISGLLCVYCGAGGIAMGLLLSGIQSVTLRFGFLDTITILKLTGFYGLSSFFLFLIICIFNFTQKKLAVIVYLTAAFFLIGLTQFNCRSLPNVLLIVSDATRADHLSLYGYHRQTTPFLDKFAEETVVFNQAMAQGTSTIVSTPSLLASVYPSEIPSGH